MAWLGRWLWSWGGRWLGYDEAGQQQPADAVPYTRYGRVRKSSTDRLFGFSEGSWQCTISPGAVILQRTNTDDYVRMRVPDTDCPPLPQPGTPLDSGQADEAEPNRWQVSGTPNTSNKWLIKQQTDQIQLSYPCYPGAFELEFEISDLSVLSGGALGVIFDGIVVELKIDDNNWACVGFGFTVGGLPGFCWQRMVNGQLSQGHVGGPWEPYESVFRARVIRSGSSWAVQVWSSANPVWSNPIHIGPIGSGPVWVRIRGLRAWLGSGYNWYSSRNVQGRIRYLVSNSVAPDFISVTTPVVDLGQPQRVLVRGLPSGTQLVWRAANELPLPDHWDSPVGEFRYWQAKLSTSSIPVLLERIEFFTGDSTPPTSPVSMAPRRGREAILSDLVCPAVGSRYYLPGFTLKATWGSLWQALRYILRMHTLDLPLRFAEYPVLGIDVFAVDCETEPRSVVYGDVVAEKCPDPIRFQLLPDPVWYWNDGRLYLRNLRTRTVGLSWRGGMLVPEKRVTPDPDRPVVVDAGEWRAGLWSAGLHALRVEWDGRSIKSISIDGLPFALPQRAYLFYTPFLASDVLEIEVDGRRQTARRIRLHQLEELCHAVQDGSVRRVSHAVRLMALHGSERLWSPLVPPSVLIWNGTDTLHLPDRTTQVEVEDHPSVGYGTSAEDSKVPTMRWRAERNGDWITALVPNKEARPGRYVVRTVSDTLVVGSPFEPTNRWMDLHQVPAPAGSSRYVSASARLQSWYSVRAESWRDPLKNLTVWEYITTDSVAHAEVAGAKYATTWCFAETGYSVSPEVQRRIDVSASAAVQTGAEIVTSVTREVAVSGSVSTWSKVYFPFSASVFFSTSGVAYAGVRRGTTIQQFATVTADVAASKSRDATTDVRTVFTGTAIGSRVRSALPLPQTTIVTWYEIRVGSKTSISIMEFVSTSATVVAGRVRSPQAMVFSSLGSAVSAGARRTTSASADATSTYTVTAELKPASWVDASATVFVDSWQYVKLYKERDLYGEVLSWWEIATSVRREPSVSASAVSSATATAGRVRDTSIQETVVSDYRCIAGVPRSASASVSVISSATVSAEVRSTPVSTVRSRVWAHTLLVDTPGSRQPARIGTALLGTQHLVEVTDQQALQELAGRYGSHTPVPAALAFWQADVAVLVIGGDPEIQAVTRGRQESPPVFGDD